MISFCILSSSSLLLPKSEITFFSFNLFKVSIIALLIYFFSSSGFNEPKSKIKLSNELGSGFTVYTKLLNSFLSLLL